MNQPDDAAAQDAAAAELNQILRDEGEVAAVRYLIPRVTALWRLRSGRLREKDLLEDRIQETVLRALLLLRKGEVVRELNAFIWHCAKWSDTTLFRGEKRANSVGGSMRGDDEQEDFDEGDSANEPLDAQRNDLMHRLCRKRVIAQLYLDRPDEIEWLARMADKRIKGEDMAQWLAMTHAAFRQRISRFYAYGRNLCKHHCGTEKCQLN